MKERIEKKLKEKIEFILSKKVDELTRDEYEILVAKLGNIKFEETKQQKSEELSKICSQLFNY